MHAQRVTVPHSYENNGTQPIYYTVWDLVSASAKIAIIDQDSRNSGSLAPFLCRMEASAGAGDVGSEGQPASDRARYGVQGAGGVGTCEKRRQVRRRCQGVID